MAIYADLQYGGKGTEVIISIWDNFEGKPRDVLKSFMSTITEVDFDGALTETIDEQLVGNQRFFASIVDPYTMLSDTTYWIGMSGIRNDSLTQTGLFEVSGGDSKMALFYDGVNFQDFAVITGDMAFRLYGSPVPEPSTALLLGIGLIGTALAGRRMRRA